jgi:hypothetical protein
MTWKLEAKRDSFAQVVRSAGEIQRGFQGKRGHAWNLFFQGRSPDRCARDGRGFQFQQGDRGSSPSPADLSAGKNSKGRFKSRRYARMTQSSVDHT